MNIHDMTGGNNDFGSESAEVHSIEAGMNLTKYSNEDLFEEIARRNYAVVIVFLPRELPDISVFCNGASWLCASMADAFSDRIRDLEG